MEKLEERYLRWAMGLNSNRPGYMDKGGTAKREVEGESKGVKV